MTEEEGKFRPQQESGSLKPEGGDIQKPEGTVAGDPKETSEQTQADFVLTPEIEEMVMEKVRNIRERGLGYSAVMGLDYNNFENIFRKGLLAKQIKCSDPEYHVNLDGSSLKKGKEGLKEIRKFKGAKKGNQIYFNITGRESWGGIADSEYARAESTSIFILFDISHSQETRPADDSKKPSYPIEEGEMQKRNVFWARNWRSRGSEQESWTVLFGDLMPGDPRIKESPRYKELVESGSIGEDGLPKNETEWGFAIPGRVSPRFFVGIILKCDALEDVRATETVANRDNPDLLVPIYNLRGDLLWPKQMSYEDVKKFVAERDARKQKGNKDAK